MEVTAHFADEHYRSIAQCAASLTHGLGWQVDEDRNATHGNFPIVHRTHIDIFGFLYPPWFSNWCQCPAPYGHRADLRMQCLGASARLVNPQWLETCMRISRGRLLASCL